MNDDETRQWRQMIAEWEIWIAMLRAGLQDCVDDEFLDTVTVLAQMTGQVRKIVVDESQRRGLEKRVIVW